MARAQKLKVYRTPAGFHDAYVAAPSQKAALQAWGSDRDLFARGIAEIVTDPVLTAAPLATPGVVVKLSRGTTTEQIAALPDRAARPAPVANDAGKSEPTSLRSKKVAPKKVASKKAPPKKVARRAPKPDTVKLDAAEQARDRLEADYDRQLKDIAAREAVLARERGNLERARKDALQQAQDAVDAQSRAYDLALRKWRG